MKTIILITDSFPYNSTTEVSFVSPELEYLSRYFDRVIIAPIVKRGEKMDIKTLPEHVEVSNTLLLDPSTKNKLFSLIGNLTTLIRDIKKSKRNFRKAVAYTAYVGLCYQNIKNLIKEYNLDLNHTLFYTFWFKFTTDACSLIPGTKVITRVHGHDLYEERYYISKEWRIKSLKNLITCFSNSESAHKYLSKKYPQFKDKFKSSRLGSVNTYHMDKFDSESDNIEDSNVHIKIEPKTSKKVSLVGISRLSPEKGMTRQIRFIIDFATSYPEWRISYDHIGDGIQRPEIEKMLTQLPPNLAIHLHGELHNDDVHKLLQSRFFDSILLLSHSEGSPIALCEALSYGIPAIATNVGGIPEIFAAGGGVIVPSDILDNEIFDSALLYVISHRNKLSVEARKIWEKEFNAVSLRETFANQIAALLD